MTSIFKTPILRQCFVTMGVTLNFGSAGLVMGCSTGFLEQLQRPDSLIPVDDSSGSWIAAIPTLSILLGNLVSVPIVSRFGRKNNILLSSTLMAVGWICMYFTASFATLLVCRFISGLGLGLNYSSGPMLIGEYTSPKHRGAFLTLISLILSIMTLLIHQLALNLGWQVVSIICGAYSVISTIIIGLSPESPSWLISKGRYEEGRIVFRWLRGEHEEEELERVIEADVEFVKTTRDHSAKQSIKRKLYMSIEYFKTTVVKKEFYKPTIIIIHIFTITHWSGANLYSSYADLLFRKLNIGDFNILFLILIIDITRVIINFLATYITKGLKRRTVYFTSTGVAILILLLTAAYTYVRECGALPFDHPAIGLLLTIVHTMSTVIGPTSLSFVIFGEIIPLEYKNLAGAISMVWFSIQFFLAVKTFPYLISRLEVVGTYCVCGAILTYCALVTWFMLPETRDRTLQDIEDEFRGRSARPEQARPLAGT